MNDSYYQSYQSWKCSLLFHYLSEYLITKYDSTSDMDVEVTTIKTHAVETRESIRGARGFRNREDWKLNGSLRPIVLQVGVELFREIAGRFVERIWAVAVVVVGQRA